MYCTTLLRTANMLLLTRSTVLLHHIMIHDLVLHAILEILL